MNVLKSSDHLGEAVARAQGHWQARLKAVALAKPPGERPLPAALTIAVSREEGANGTAVAQKVGERLGWHVYDHELLHRIADEMGLRESLLESIDERGRSWLMIYLQAFVRSRSISEGAYLYHLSKVVLSLAVHGECVIVGRGAALFLPPDMTLRVRLVAPLNERIAEVQRRFDLTPDLAARRVEETDTTRDHFIREHFHKTPTEPANYDLVLNTTRFGVEKTADLIEEAARRFQTLVSAP